MFTSAPASARPAANVDAYAVDLGETIAFDVDVCSKRPLTVRFEAHFIQGARTATYRRWHSESYGPGCSRVFLALPDTRDRLQTGLADARLRIRVRGMRRAFDTRWRRFEVL